MALTARAPNTVFLGGHKTDITGYVAVETITPGMIIEYHNDSGTLKWGVHDSADGAVQRVVALDQPALNKGISDTVAAGSEVLAAALSPGARFNAIIPSGQNITQGAYLQSNGDGKLKALGSGTGAFVAVETIGSVSADTRCRVEVT